LPSKTRQATGAVDSAGLEPEQMSAMLSGKMTLLVEAIELHDTPWIPHLHGTPAVRW
jgi:hypothetical protein